MGQLNYSPLKPKSAVSVHGNKEMEPKPNEKIRVQDQNEDEREPVEEVKTSSQPSPVEVIPELPEIDKELLDEGVEVIDHDTIFVGNRKIDLPLPLEKIDQGLHKPVTSGWRWISELTRYILARLHIVIRKVGDKFKLVEQD